MRNKYYADLHTHCTASDGDLDPEALVDAACEAGLEVISVTDHDTVVGLERAVARGRERGIEVIEGCELTAYVGWIEVHMLAYFFGVQRGPLHELIDSVVKFRRERALKMGRLLTDAGYPVADEDILSCLPVYQVARRLCKRFAVEIGRQGDRLGPKHVK